MNPGGDDGETTRLIAGTVNVPSAVTGGNYNATHRVLSLYARVPTIRLVKMICNSYFLLEKIVTN
jgi:hypothetical protein